VVRIEDGKFEPVAGEMGFGEVAENCLILISSRTENKELRLVKN
jgi:hypothetical protein